MKTAPVLTLGREGMGEAATEEDFDSWVMFVAKVIDVHTGFPVMVDERGARESQWDDISGADDAERHAINLAKQELWDNWRARPIEDDGEQVAS